MLKENNLVSVWTYVIKEENVFPKECPINKELCCVLRENKVVKSCEYFAGLDIVNNFIRKISCKK
jgi:uncharacterized membrane protein YfbV (UPF0208 family)